MKNSLLNKTTHCLNCGTQLEDANYCPHCGQLNSDRKVSLRRLFGDFFSDYFAFDSRLFRSLRPLLLKPGFLTREYLAGRRNNYILPLRFYLFTTVIFFLIISFGGLSDVMDDKIVITADDDSSVEDTVTVADSSQVMVSEEMLMEATSDTLNTLLQGLKASVIDTSLTEEDTGFFTRKVEHLEGLGENGGSILLKEMLNQLPHILFLLLPLFALILKVLYIRRRVYFVEHLIFSLHFHTFLFVIMILITLLPSGYLVIALFLGTLPYLFQSLRVVYQQSLFKTAVKFILLILLYSICLIPALLGLLFLSIAMV
jgi:hypothetical protein